MGDGRRHERVARARERHDAHPSLAPRAQVGQGLLAPFSLAGEVFTTALLVGVLHLMMITAMLLCLLAVLVQGFVLYLARRRGS